MDIHVISFEVIKIFPVICYRQIQFIITKNCHKIINAISDFFCIFLFSMPVHTHLKPGCLCTGYISDIISVGI